MMMQLDPTSHGSTVLREFDDVADPFVGSSPRICAVRALMAKLASNDSTILITGESGTGKELAARIIHETSACRHRPFVPVNCGAIPDEVLEREIFGQVRDALIGTTIPGQGRCYLANGGTILLDEIDALSPKLQVKLLRTLQERRFEPVGSDHSIQQVVRVIAATNNDLQLAVRKDKFCADLFCWLSVRRTLHLPPLRERDGDIPLLIRYFFTRAAMPKRRSKSTGQPWRRWRDITGREMSGSLKI